MTKRNDFNQNLYYLGKVCKREHIFLETNKSLRQTVNRTCVECQKLTSKKYRDLNPAACNERSKNWRGQIINRDKNILSLEKKCGVCKKMKSATDFYPAKYAADNLLGQKSSHSLRSEDGKI